MSARRRRPAYLPSARIVGLVAALPLLVSAPRVFGGDWHTGDDLHCADCHVIHASRRGVSYGGGLPAPTGYPNLLRAATTSELCLTCHDGGSGAGDSPPDVTGAASYETGSLKRAAGAFQAAVGSSTANGHDLGVAAQTAPGGSWNNGTGTSCASCHDPHGNAYYRNLLLLPGNAPSNRPVTAVTQALLTPTSTQYSVGNIRYTSATNGLAAWCQGCHTNFHGQPGDLNMGGAPGGDAPGSSSYWFRHPTTDITMAQGVTNTHIDNSYWFTGALSRVPVVSVSGVIPGSAATSDNQAFCGSCHKAHGSTHGNGLVWDDPGTVALEDGTLARQTCQACHYR